MMPALTVWSIFSGLPMVSTQSPEPTHELIGRGETGAAFRTLPEKKGGA
jgi:hypothetical protein